MRFRFLMILALLAPCLCGVAVGQSVRQPLSAPPAADYRLAFTLGDTDFDDNFRYQERTLAGVAVSAEGDTLVANTNRAQIDVFDSGGQFLRSFGGPGSGKAQFKELNGIAISPFGDIVVADTGNNRLQVFDRQDKFLFAIGREGAKPGQFRQPQGVAVGPNGNLVVADTGNDRLQVFDRKGRFLGAYSSPIAEDRTGSLGNSTTGRDGRLSAPVAVAVTHSGRMVVIDRGGSRVFDAEGRLLFSFGESLYSVSDSHADDTLRDPQSVAVDNADNIIFADEGNTRIKMFDKTGRFLRAFFSERLSPIGYNYAPHSVAVTPSGKIVVAETGGYCMEVYAPDGTLALSFGHYDIGGAGDLYYPRGIALTPEGNLLVADAMNNRIQAFDRQGKFLFMFGRFGYGDGLFSRPTSVAVSPSGEIVVADAYNNRIQVFDGKGNFKFAFGSKGKGEGEFDEPYSVAVSPLGEIIVGSFSDDRIQIFDAKGKFLRAFTDLEPYPKGGGHFSPEGIAVDSSGNIAASGGVGMIWVFDKNGKRLARFGGMGAGDGQFGVMINSVAFNRAGHIIVADTDNRRFQEFDLAGAFVKAYPFGGLDFGPYINRGGVAIDGSGNFVLADTHRDHIKVFDNSGTFMYAIGRSNSEADGHFRSCADVAVDRSGHIIVLDRLNDRVQIFDSGGRFLRAFGRKGSGVGEFHFPESVSVLPSGRIVVSDTRNKRIQVFDSKGKFLCAFGGAPSSDGSAQISISAWASPKGEIYARCSTHTGSSIQVFDSNGRFLRFSKETDPRAEGHGVTTATAPNGDIVIADDTSHTVWVYAPTH